MNLRKIKDVKIIPMLFALAFVIFGIIAKQYTFIFLGIYAGLCFALTYILIPRLREKYRKSMQLVFILSILTAGILFGFLARGTLPPRAESQVWSLHQIDNPGYLIPNGLDPADVNGDGYNDYVTNYEWDGKIRIAFYPGVSDVAESWPAITVGSIPNAENAAFGDFDNDTNIDIVVAHGSELAKQSGVFIIWGPESSNAMDPTAWIESNDIPGTVEAGQLHCAEGKDINGDGVDDIVVGGRGKDPKAGLKWIEAPFNPSERRDMTKWVVHDIDAELESGHGFEFGDIDNDGDDDIAVCNSDWDTKDEDEMLVWYKNPGTGASEQEEPWEKRIIYQGPEFYSKEQITLHDYSGDGYPEVIMQVVDYIYYFKNPGILEGSWTLIKIPKPEETKWRARPIKIVDINNDGKDDIIGMLIHHDGYFPTSKAAVFWMEYTGSDPETSSWETHVIKWADGFFGIGKYNGEKWDQCVFEDLDEDGDLDIVANCEEYHSLGFVYLSVLWFENPTIM
ncbi:MAG: hypothetical protein GF364_15730 [Candidatus Lokiarchaeota archaeon]|nr:hypothetical protein [Candidatus Lokiarchaeota archaeon]